MLILLEVDLSSLGFREANPNDHDDWTSPLKKITN